MELLHTAQSIASSNYQRWTPNHGPLISLAWKLCQISIHAKVSLIYCRFARVLVSHDHSLWPQLYSYIKNHHSPRQYNHCRQNVPVRTMKTSGRLSEYGKSCECSWQRLFLCVPKEQSFVTPSLFLFAMALYSLCYLLKALWLVCHFLLIRAMGRMKQKSLWMAPRQHPKG